MRQLLIGDCHFGRHSNSVVWLENQLKFFNTQVIDILNTKNINRVVFLGDLFESRYSTNTQVGCEVKNLIRKLLTSYPNIDFVIIAGNHDFYSPQEEFHSYNMYDEIFGQEFIDAYSNFRICVYEEYYDVNTKDLFLPWYSTENFNTFQDTIFKYKGLGINNIFVHSDLIGWDNSYKTLVGDTNVWAGHIHYWVERDNYHIIGSAFSFDFADVNMSKYLYILEGNQCVERIENITTPKFKRFYNEAIFTLSREDFENSYVEIYIYSSNQNKASYIERIKELNKEYAEYPIRKHTIDDSMGETLELAYFNTNINNYIESNIPDYLVNKYQMVKDKLKNKEEL